MNKEKIKLIGIPFGIIDNDLIVEDFLSDIDLSIYTILKTTFYNPNYNCGIFSMIALYDIVKSTENTQRKAIKESIQSLINKRYISIQPLISDIDNVYELEGTDSIIELDPHLSYKVYFDLCYITNFEDDITYDNGFTVIPIKNINLLLTYICNNNKRGLMKYKLIRYYLLIARQCSNSSKCGYISMKKIYSLIGVSERTCSNYNTMLQEIGLIYYNNDYAKGTSTQTMCTLFCHRNVLIDTYDKYYADKEYFNSYLTEVVTSKKLNPINKQELNDKRSKTQTEKLKVKKGDV